jgi:hypothetical protein
VLILLKYDALDPYQPTSFAVGLDMGVWADTRADMENVM